MNWTCRLLNISLFLDWGWISTYFGCYNGYSTLFKYEFSYVMIFCYIFYLISCWFTSWGIDGFSIIATSLCNYANLLKFSLNYFNRYYSVYYEYVISSIDVFSQYLPFYDLVIVNAIKPTLWITSTLLTFSTN